MNERHHLQNLQAFVPTRLLTRCRTLFFCFVLLPAANQVFAQTGSFEFSLTAEQGRQVPVLVTHPASGQEVKALIVFSHGAFAAPDRYTRLLDAWAEAGYVVVAPMHVDSELNPDREKYDGAQTMLTRMEDFGLLATDGQLQDELKAAGIDAGEVVIAAGHSYGGLIAQLAGGARLSNGTPTPEPMLAAQGTVDAVVALSPPGPFAGTMEVEGWSSLSRPMLVVTGTTDILPGFVDDWRMHLASYEASQSAPAYALVFANQDHYFNGAFGRPLDSLEPDVVRALNGLNRKTLQFLDALLAGDLPGRAQWEGMSDDVVEARASAVTAQDQDDKGES